jgi:DNA-binding CsgD family transcriptional regulator
MEKTVNTREHVLGQAIEVIESGSCVEIVGHRGSGRSRMLARITSHFLNRSWRVESVRCVASLSSFPLVALSMAGIQAARESRVSSLPAVVSELADRLPRGKSVVVIDDWDDLDEVSWGAIATLQREHGIPVALARLAGRGALSTPTGLHGSTLEPSFAIALKPLHYEELQQALTEHLGGSVESSTLSLLYAKSGGNVGLAVALADAGRWEHSLEVRNAQWTASRQLWSETLSLKLEALLEPLAAGQREVMETLSILGAADVETALKFTDVDELGRLEALSLVEFYSVGSRYLIGVHPPLLAEHLRRRPAVARRLRIMQTSTEPPELCSPDTHGGTVLTTANAAQFVRLVQEHQRTRLLLAHAEWTRSGSPEAGIAYLDAAMDSAATRREIDVALDETAIVARTGDAWMQWMVRWAEHRAYAHRDPESAIRRLRSEASVHPELGTILVARAVEIETGMLTVPGLEDLPEANEATDPRVAAAVFRARAYVHTTRGEVSASEEALDRLAGIADVRGDYVVASIRSMNAIARADVASVVEESLREFAEARSGFDSVSLRCHAEILVFCAIIDGRYRDVDRILDEVSGLGQPSSRPPFAHLGLTIMGSVAASRQGHRKAARLRLEDAHRIPTPDGPFPAQIRGWAEVHSQASLGNPDEAAAIAAAAGDLLWERGARFAAALAYVTGLELMPSLDELDRVSERVNSVQGEFLAAQFDYARASATRDAHGLARSASTLWDQKRFGIALAAFTEAADVYAGLDDVEAAARLSRRRDELERTLPEGSYDADRFDARFVQLSDRELEIAQLVAAGLANRQVADELVLSVRTVETHLLRVMRKARVAKRSQLRGFLERMGHNLT